MKTPDIEGEDSYVLLGCAAISLGMGGVIFLMVWGLYELVMWAVERLT